MYPKNYFKGDIIVQEGDTGHALYVIAGKYIYNSVKNSKRQATQATLRNEFYSLTKHSLSS